MSSKQYGTTWVYSPIPCGGVRAQDFEPDASKGRLLIAHEYRDGWHS